jgi:hypothetical protein
MKKIIFLIVLILVLSGCNNIVQYPEYSINAYICSQSIPGFPSIELVGSTIKIIDQDAKLNSDIIFQTTNYQFGRSYAKLQEGKYFAEISYPGYQTKIQEFAVNNYSKGEYYSIQNNIYSQLLH